MTAARKAQQRWAGPVRDRKCLRLISYGRLSVKQRGRNGKVVELLSETIERQLEHNAARAARDGHTIAHVLIDDGISAYDESKTRDGWEEGLRLIRAGEADGFLAWHSDRAVRQPIDAIYLMNAAKEAGIPVMFGEGSKVYDFSDSTDEFMFLMEAGIGKKSSADTSRRVADKMEANRKAGKLGGRHCYGFMADPKGGPRLVNPHEAEVIRAVAARVLAGDTWKDIVDDLEEAGETTGRRAFTRTAMRLVLLAPRVAGLVEHKGEIVGPIRDRDGNPQEPILDRQTWERVCSELKGRAKGAPRTKRNLLTGLIRCGACGGRMSCSVKGNRRVYQCRGDAENNGKEGTTGCWLTVKAEAAEEAVRDAVLLWQANPKRLAQITKANAVIDTKVAQLQDQLDRLLEISKRNLDKLSRGVWDQDTYDLLDSPNSDRIVELRAELKAFAQPSVLRDLAVESLTTSWDSASQEEQRAMVKVALKSLKVMPVGREGSQLDPRLRVVCLPR